MAPMSALEPPSQLQRMKARNKDVQLNSSSSPPSKADAALLLLLPHLVAAEDSQQQQASVTTSLALSSGSAPGLAINTRTNDVRSVNQRGHLLEHSITTQVTEDLVSEKNDFVAVRFSSNEDHFHSRRCSSLNPICLFSQIQPDPLPTLLHESSGNRGSLLSVVGKMLKEHIEKEEPINLRSEAMVASSQTNPTTKDLVCSSHSADKVSTHMDIQETDPTHELQITDHLQVTNSHHRHKHAFSTSQQRRELSSRLANCTLPNWVSPSPMAITHAADIIATSDAFKLVSVAPPLMDSPLRMPPVRTSPRKAFKNTGTAACTSQSTTHSKSTHRAKNKVKTFNRKALTAAIRRRMIKIKPPPLLWAPLPKTQRLDAASMIMAQRAAELAHQILDSDTVNSKRFYNALAVQHAATDFKDLQHSAIKNSIPPPGASIHEGFEWSAYPPLEKVLQSHMADFYEISLSHNQSPIQSDFISRLVDEICEMAVMCGWTLTGRMADRRLLRDRVRCYYKTQLQNAKKRFQTCLKHPMSKSSARHLLEMWSLMQKFSAPSGTKRDTAPSHDAKPTA